MQCPTCGSTTAGTLDRCANCGTPTAAAPARDLGGATALDGPARPGGGEAFGERTVVVPGPGFGGQDGMPLSAPPAASPTTAASAASGPSANGFSVPSGPSGPAANGFSGPSGNGEGGGGDVPPPPVPAWASSEPAAADPESTAAWVFDPAESGEHQQAPPADPHPAEMKTIIAPSPAAAAAAQNWQDGAAENPAESIVPESWYAKPRRPDEQAEQSGPQQWQPQHTVADQGWGQQPPPPPGGFGQPGAGEQPTTMLDGGGLSPSAPGGFGQQQDFGQQPGFGQQQGFGQQPGFGQDAGFGHDPGFGGPGGGFGQQGYEQGGFDQGGFDQGGFGQQGFQGAPPSGSRKKKPGKPLLIGVGALVAAAAVAVTVVMWPTGGKGGASPNSSKSPVAQKSKLPADDAAREQAGALNAILNASADTKRTLVKGLGQSRKCEDLGAATDSFKLVAQRRQNQLKRTAALKVDKLANGEKLRSSLRDSLQASLDVDQALLTWATQSQKGCKGKPKPDAAHAPGRADAERRATSSKKSFVDLWNPVARKTGQPARHWTGV
ncbi:hypothetical protein [Actinomadura gamaensis]|uniref:Uncharacterized protein n=1 Tax=Actinomadura gamaensis TaxID=1763541 RepID=A0ABV9UBH9_9ACTN